MEYLIYPLWALFGWCCTSSLYLLVWTTPAPAEVVTVNRIAAVAFAILSGVILELIARF